VKLIIGRPLIWLIGSERGEREYIYYISTLCNLPDIETQDNKNTTKKTSTQKTEGRMRVKILHLLSCVTPRQLKTIRHKKPKRGENHHITSHLLSCINQ